MKVEEIKLAFETNVQLSNIQVLNKIINEGKRITSRGESFMKEKDVFLRTAKTLNADSSSLLSGGMKFIQDFEKNAKNLGVAPNSVVEYNAAMDMLGVLNTVSKQTEAYK